MAGKGVAARSGDGSEVGGGAANGKGRAAGDAESWWPGWKEWHFRELVENAMEGIARISPEDGTIEYCNPAYARILGSTQKGVAGRSFFEFVHEGDELKARRQRELRLKGMGTRYEVTATAADGARKVLLCGGYPLYGRDGSYEGAVQTITDITEGRRAEEALKRSEERFRQVARATGEAIWDNDLTTGVQAWDGATEALFGYPPHRAWTGEWWEARIHPEDRERVLSDLDAIVHGSGESWEDEYRFLRADGSYAHVLDRGFVVRGAEGRAVRMVGSMRDVTERAKHEEELRRRPGDGVAVTRGKMCGFPARMLGRFASRVVVGRGCELSKLSGPSLRPSLYVVIEL